ncbi:ATP-binding protein [Afipia felis]|nr:ATP-binding protein [Afipia felis]
MTIGKLTRGEFEATLQAQLSPTTPIRSPEFLRGRDKILEDIRRAFVQPGRHIFIHGDRGVGKTSLAQTAAIEHQSSDGAALFIGCDNSSTFYTVARSIAQKLVGQGDPTVARSSRTGKISGGWKGFISAEASQTIERGAVPDMKTIDETVSILGYLAEQHSQKPVIVIDEFERITEASERMLFADFIKQIGDQSVPIKFVFCGIGSALSDLLDAHHSCYRYLTAVPLERLALHPCLEIIFFAAKALGITVEDTSLYRIAQISDGFPHYVHLMSEKLFWQAFVDENDVKQTNSTHYTTAIRASVIDIEPHLKAMYEKASLKYKADYESVLWAVADHHQLKRRSTDIYQSYIRIQRKRGEEPLPRETFNSRMNSLKRASHASIVKGNRAGWYEFSEAVVRGYVRLRAEEQGIVLGNDHPLDGRSPDSLANQPTSNIFKSRE